MAVCRQISCVSLSIAVAGSLCAVSASATPPSGSSWQLTFDDEFSGSSLDSTKWNSTGNVDNPDRELQAYRASNVEVSGGTCKLWVKAESYNGKSVTSGKITTEHKFSQKYGYFEARIKLPHGKGHWPAFWTLPDPFNWPPEFDIMEAWNHDDTGQTWFSGGVHYGSNYPQDGGNWAGKDEVSKSTSFNLCNDFHTFALEWDDTHEAWYLDDQKFGTVTAHVLTMSPHFMMVQVAIDGQIGMDATTAPKALEIDYVRVYEKGTGTGTGGAGTGGGSSTGGSGTGGGSSTGGASTGGNGAGGTGTGGHTTSSGGSGAASTTTTGGTAAGGAGNDAGDSPTGSDSGCACRQAQPTHSHAPSSLSLALVLGLFARRRARRLSKG